MTGEHTKPVESLSEDHDLVAWARLRVADREWTINADRLNSFADEIERLRKELAQEKRRSFQDGRITYKGFNYGVGSQWGIDSLRRAIEGNGHG